MFFDRSVYVEIQRADRVAKAKAKQRKTDPALELLVRERLKGDEIVLFWSEHVPREVTIFLIREELNRVSAPIHRMFSWPAPGSGRALCFKRLGDQWVFQRVGGWTT
jgi:hypothetical protein